MIPPHPHHPKNAIIFEEALNLSLSQIHLYKFGAPGGGNVLAAVPGSALLRSLEFSFMKLYESRTTERSFQPACILDFEIQILNVRLSFFN